jgi:uncharacterized protein with PIN domain
MLGKITRWLRMLGYNVKYSNAFDDNTLISTAKIEKSILLTRDMELYQQAVKNEVEALYLEELNEIDKLARLAEKFKIKLDIDMKTSRCPKCNARIKRISKAEVKEKVKKNTFTNYQDFWKCVKCEQIYWQGAHWTKITNTLEAAKEKLKKVKK